MVTNTEGPQMEPKNKWPEFLHPNQGWFFAAAGVVAAFIVGKLDAPLWLALVVLALLLLAAILYPWITKNKTRRILFWAILSICVVVITLGLIFYSRTVPPVANLSIQWNRTKLPINLIDSDASSEYYVLLVRKGDNIPHLSVAFPLHSPTTWPAKSDRNGSLRDFIEVATVTNQEDQGMLDIHIPFEMYFAEPRPLLSGGFTCAETETTAETRDWTIAALEAHRSAVLFIINGTNECVYSIAPQWASLKLVGYGVTSAKISHSIDNPMALMFGAGVPLFPTKGDWSH